MRSRLISLLLLAAVTVLAAGCGSSGAAGGGRLQVVAAENFWGSLAAQLGGDRVDVTSIIHSPDADPHDYEPTAADARAMAEARMAIVNGIGYDPWAPKLLSANPAGGRVVLTVGDVVGIKAGGNPHRWYSPANVQQVIDAIVADYKRLDGEDAAYFDAQKVKLETQGLAGYKRLIATIRAKYAGVPVGASESIFAPLAEGLGLRLVTPEGFLNAVSEGSDPTASDKTTADRQIRTKQIRLWVFNSQNSTPDVQRLTGEARAAGIPVATVTETLTPAGASFQQWQSRQLREIEAALGSAGTG
jgi:zinc/manganese transport system substrate-binding protein